MPIVTLDDLLAGKPRHSIHHGTLPRLTATEQARTRNYIRILPHEIKVHIFQLHIENILDRTTSPAFRLHHPADRDRYHDAVIAGKLLAAGNKLLDGVPDAAGDIRISVQLLVKEKLKQQRQISASQETIKRLEVELKALTQLATRCVRVLDPADPAEEAKPDPQPFGYEFNEDGTFFDAGGDADGGREWSFGDLDGADHDDLDEEYPAEDFCPTPSTIRLDLEDESKEGSRHVMVKARPVRVDYRDDDVEIHRKEESWSWPATMKEKKPLPISLMENLESCGYRLNDEGTVWIAPPPMKKVEALRPPRQVVVKKEESKLSMVKVEEAEGTEHDPEPFGYTFNDDGTFYGA